MSVRKKNSRVGPTLLGAGQKSCRKVPFGPSPPRLTSAKSTCRNGSLYELRPFQDKFALPARSNATARLQFSIQKCFEAAHEGLDMLPSRGSSSEVPHRKKKRTPYRGVAPGHYFIFGQTCILNVKRSSDPETGSKCQYFDHLAVFHRKCMFGQKQTCGQWET